MALAYTFVCPLPNGVHARPASAIEEVTRRFTSAVSIENLRTAAAADAKSVLGIVGLDVRADDTCRLAIAGEDEQEALAALSAFFDETFPHCDDGLLEGAAATESAVALPRVLAEAKARVLRGTPVVPGIGEGVAVVVGAFVVPATIPLRLDGAGSTGHEGRRAELARTERALERLATTFDTLLGRVRAGIEADLVRTHLSVARDPGFRQHLRKAIKDRNLSAAGAIASAEGTFTAMLAATGSALLRERALDIRDVCVQLLREVYGPGVGGQEIVLDEDAVCVADVLTPGQFLALDAARLKGLVLAHAGTTSHTVILARSRGVPTLVGAEGVENAGLHGRRVILDAGLGVLVTEVTPPVRRYYDMERRRIEGRERRQRFHAERPAATADGRRIEVGANIAVPEEAATAFAAGAEGIGLFRTEMLFVDRDAAPREDEQFEAYRRVVEDARGRPVIIRTLDVGGDKALRYLKLPREDNPFLGYRAVRIYQEVEPLFREQVRALLRASACGPLSVMVPMVSRVEEAAWVKAVMTEERQRLADRGVPLGPPVRLGAMIEVPAAAFLIDRLSRHLEFFSIGTNDLLQYFAAVDRSNPKVEPLNTASAPAFLALLQKIVDEAHEHGCWVGVCGEMAGRPEYLPLLAGLGVDEISMAAPLVPAAKTALSLISGPDAAALLHQALRADTAGEVDGLLRNAASGLDVPLISPELVVRRGRAETKAEAIKEAVDRLYAAGRTDSPREVEEAAWRLEGFSTTGFGGGFAIPHCKTDAVRANSLVLVKLQAGVDWESVDDRPVRVVILLAIRESAPAQTHLRVLSALARRLMQEDFRERIEREDDPQALCEYLRETVATEE